MDQAVKPVRYVVLTNDKDLSFQNVWDSEHAKTEEEKLTTSGSSMKSHKN